MSKIEVNKIGPQCGTTLTVGCGAGQTVAVDANTVTIGRCGGTVALASGASQTGFGRTGTVDWQTGSIKTTGFTAANGEGYFVDTSSGAVTATLPSSPSPGNIVAFADYTRTFATNNLTIGRNSQPIGGVAQDALLEVNGQSATFVYVDGTEGWININETQTSVTGETPFIAATGGTITTSGDYRIHTFTGPGTFAVDSAASNSPGPAFCGPTRNNVSYLVVAGGGGGASACGGGAGGAGGFREFRAPLSGCYSVSPLNGNPGGTSITVTKGDFPIVVGGGGAGGPTGGGAGTAGNTSSFSTVTSAGGGFGGEFKAAGGNGGSGGGGGSRCNAAGGSGNTPPVSPPQGNNGGNSAPASNPSTIDAGGSGGGAGAAGSNASNNSGVAGAVGVPTSITGSALSYAGGGGGNAESGSYGPGSPCGTGGAGGTGPDPNSGVAGTTNRGGGGGGGKHPGTGGAGGSGVVIIRYKYQ